MAYLDDQNGRPVQQRFLDLMALKPQQKEEVKSAMHRLAELKLRPEKIPDEEDVVYPLSWKNIKEFPYLDPVPTSMLHADIKELSAVEIDWKMLTLDRPESQLEISIFSRMVYLNKLMTKCILVERQKKERDKYIRLRTKGKMKVQVDSDVDKSDEFTYDYFSRFFGSIDRGGPMDELPKPSAEQDPKGAKSPAPADNQPANKAVAPPPAKKGKGLRVKKKLKRRKKKKKSRKSKLRKRRTTAPPRPKMMRSGERLKKLKRNSSMNKGKKGKTVVLPRKKVVSKGLKPVVKKKPDSSKTLIQMLKASEQEKKKKESSLKS